MKDVVNEILQAEEKVEESLQKAREEAAGYKKDADREVNSIIGKAREKAQDSIREAVEEAKREAGIARNEAIKKAEEESRKLIDRNRAHIGELVEEIVTLVIGEDYLTRVHRQR